MNTLNTNTHGWSWRCWRKLKVLSQTVLCSAVLLNLSASTLQQGSLLSFYAARDGGVYGLLLKQQAPTLFTERLQNSPAFRQAMLSWHVPEAIIAQASLQPEQTANLFPLLSHPTAEQTVLMANLVANSAPALALAWLADANLLAGELARQIALNSQQPALLQQVGLQRAQDYQLLGDRKAATCAYPITFAVTNAQQWQHAKWLQQTTREQAWWSATEACFTAPLLVNETELACLQQQGRELCQLTLFQDATHAGQLAHLVILAGQGNAYKQGGYIKLPSAASPQLWWHELAHWYGFWDEYPWPDALTQAVCEQQQTVDAVNLRLSGSAVAEFATPLRRCGQAMLYSTLPSWNFMRHYEATIDAKAIALWQSSHYRPEHLAWNFWADCQEAACQTRWATLTQTNAPQAQ